MQLHEVFRDDIVYAEAAQFLAGLHTLAREWGSGNLDAATRKTLLGSIASVKKQLKARDLHGPAALLDVQGEIAKASGNALFVGTEEPLRIRVNFLHPREVDSYDWDALQKRDGGTGGSSQELIATFPIWKCHGR